MKRLLYILLPLAILFSGCYGEKYMQGSNIRMGKVNKPVRKKQQKTHRVSNLRKRNHRKGMRKTHVVKIAQEPKKIRKKGW